MLGWRILVLATLAVLAPAPARADAPGLREFVTEVLARNPTLRARTLARESLRTRASAEGYWPDPEVSVMLDRVPERMDGEMPMLRYQVSQMIMWPGKLGLMESAALQRAEGAAADADQRRLELIRDAQQAYLMFALNRGYREVNATTRKLLETVTRAAIARYGAGTGGHHEVVRAEVERSALEVDAIALDGERVSIVAMLNALRDRPADAAFAEPSLADADSIGGGHSFAELMRLSVNRRPELKKMRAMVREETAMAALARRERYPDFMTGVWYNQMLGGADTGGVMVGANIPLFSVPRQNRRAAASDLSAQSAQSESTGMQAMIRYQVADALRRVNTAARTLELVTAVARPRAEQSFSSALSSYATGTADMVFVLDAWRALQRMEQARIDAIVARRMAVADLEWAIGGPLSAGAP
jgi:cobalt-zinc-cadmium efflux system outer membrane protein